MKRFITFIVLLTWGVLPALAGQPGIVLMHGKRGGATPGSPVGELAGYLREHGYTVLTPDMPWSARRRLDSTYAESMAEIDSYVETLRRQGIEKIVVAGHSMGANAALGYAARRDGLAGVMAIAPGHVPELAGFQAKMSNDWRRAKVMVEQGRGGESAAFKDVRQGEVSEKNLVAANYLSWYDPKGEAVIPANVSRLRPGTALLWIIGYEDRMYERGRGYAYRKAPAHPRNAYVKIESNHKNTPFDGADEILAWLKQL